MTNFDFYKDQILTIAENGSGLALRRNGELTACDNVCCCEDCMFDNNVNACDCNMNKWLYSEHVEKPKINKRTKMLFDAIGTGWVARCSNGSLYIFAVDNKPTRLCSCSCSVWICDQNLKRMRLSESNLPFLTLDFIKWEDNEPWRVEDIRNLEVED